MSTRLEHVRLVRAVCDRCGWCGAARWTVRQAEGDGLEHASEHDLADAGT